MANYKVPQNVEADDKLLGPFSFRQFIYLMIVVAAIGVGYVLFRILPPLVVIPLPVVVFFGALALPLRKDQPMEIYLAAILSFYLKPRQRMWDPDGIETLVQIAAPRNQEVQRTKNVTSGEAVQRLRYLSDLSDTHGWSVRGIHDPNGSSLNTDVYNEAQQTQDPLDSGGILAQNLNHMISQTDQRRHEEMINQFQAAVATPSIPLQPQYAPPDPYTVLSQPQDAPYTAALPTTNPFDTMPAPHFDPYPVNMNQTVIQPLSIQAQMAQAQPVQPPPQPLAAPPQTTTSANPISPDIIKLASNTDLSIETISREAHRINEKEASLSDSDEVVISLR